MVNLAVKVGNKYCLKLVYTIQNKSPLFLTLARFHSVTLL